jgi:uncharacterized protein (TIGR03435 family)
MSCTWLWLSRILAAVPIGIGVWNAPPVRPQTAPMTFDVTSVKPLSPKHAGFQGVQPACKGGHFEANTPVFITMEWAYNLDAHQNAEFRDQLPKWTQTTRDSYELAATTGPDVTDEQCRKMTQKLFEDRFHFKYHWDTTTGKVYEMTPARGGFKMEPANPGDTASNASITVSGKESKPLPESSLWLGITMDELASFISAGIPRDFTPVIDKTGIQGRFKLKIAFALGAAVNRPFADPDLFSAVEQQLGLKLQEARGPIAHFVVDSIAMPDPN